MLPYEKGLRRHGSFDGAGRVVVEYTYDAWGAPTSVTGSAAETIGQLNPFRYRGYYYDAETGMYYLQSRYYNPVVGRFLNADDTNYLSSDGTISSRNLFSYCDNDAINKIDTTGRYPQRIINQHFNYNIKFPIKGYINGQSRGNASSLMFGNYKSSYNGCGWIATYNAYYALGWYLHPAYIIRFYESRFMIANGAIGVMPWQIALFFSLKGYKITITDGGNRFDSIAKKHRANILLFISLQTAHYVACVYKDKRFICYNVYSNITQEQRYISIMNFLRDMKAIACTMISIK